MKKIKYIGFYDIDSFESENRVKSLAAVNKMNYVAYAGSKAGFEIKIISPSWSSNSKGFYKGRENKIFENVTLKIGPTFGAKFFFTRKLRILFSWLWLFFFLIKNIEKNEKIIVYHSMMAIYPILYAQKIKKFKIILELAEIYQDASSFSKSFRNLEMQIIRSANSYILSSEMLCKKINTEKKFIINYGDYKVSSFETNFDSEKIHIVYAGIIDRVKKGAFNAIDCAKFLNEKYIIHIIGFGNNNDIIKLKESIVLNNKESKCQVIYDGIKTGQDYIKYISKCNIGLSTQSNEAKFNDTSFPSKIISYLSMGLRVVSVDIPALKSSQISNLLYYYKDNTSKSIAETILKIDFNLNYDSKRALIDLHKNFIFNVKKILK